jgi:hypothetical protein
MSLIFTTTCHPEYSKPWIFPTLSNLSCRTCALLDPDDARTLPANVERIPFRSGRFYQAGQFLDAFNGTLDRDDVVVLADADALVQRDFTEAERAMLLNIGDAVAAGTNMGWEQIGQQEMDILRPKPSVERLAAALRVPEIVLCYTPMYNWGLVAAKVSTWNLLRKLYAATTRYTNPQSLFVHPTWMQFILNVLLTYYQVPVVEMGYGLHSHGHFGIQDEHRKKDGKLHYKGEVVFYSHFIHPDKLK